MTQYLGCEAARTHIEALLDEELSVAEQVAVEAHLRWCTTCAARVADLQVIGASICTVSEALRRPVDPADEAGLVAGVLARLDAEHDQSVGVRLRESLSDRRLLWPTLGAMLGVVLCLCGLFGVLRLTLHEQPRSLAAMLDLRASPGSDENPMRLDPDMAAPRVLNAFVTFGDLPDDEAMFALSTTVTREGKVASYELLQSQRVATRSIDRRAREDRQGGHDVSALLDAVRAARFSPAQAPGGQTVAVNMVWVIARTTVKGSAHPTRDFELPSGAGAPTQDRSVPAAAPGARPREQSALPVDIPMA